MIKSCSGIVAALAFLCCCSQAEADGGNFQGKLMADRPGSQGPEWVLYEELPEDGEIVSFNQAGDFADFFLFADHFGQQVVSR
jgi:hypothetical protein